MTKIQFIRIKCQSITVLMIYNTQNLRQTIGKDKEMGMKDINADDTYRIINKIKACRSNNDINQCLSDMTKMVHCEYYLLAIIYPHSMVKSDISILDNYPKKNGGNIMMTLI